MPEALLDQGDGLVQFPAGDNVIVHYGYNGIELGALGFRVGSKHHGGVDDRRHPDDTTA